MNTASLSDNHRRVITSRIQIIERSIVGIEQLLIQPEHSSLNQVEEKLSAEEAEQLIRQLGEIQSMLADLSRRYDLTFHKKNQRAMVVASLSHMLDISEDMYAEKLKGYGSFNPELKQDYDNEIEQLEKAIKQSISALNNY
jgi:hypothetical protein